MKMLDRMQIWDLKRELKSYESKVNLIKAIIKHLEDDLTLKGGKRR